MWRFLPALAAAGLLSLSAVAFAAQSPTVLPSEMPANCVPAPATQTFTVDGITVTTHTINLAQLAQMPQFATMASRLSAYAKTEDTQVCLVPGVIAKTSPNWSESPPRQPVARVTVIP